MNPSDGALAYDLTVRGGSILTLAGGLLSAANRVTAATMKREGDSFHAYFLFGVVHFAVAVATS